MTSKDKYCMQEDNAENLFLNFRKLKIQIQQQNSFKITIKMRKWNKDMFAFLEEYFSLL